MQVKRFFAKDMKTALNDVKLELGSDAVIMSSKKVTGGIELQAALSQAHASQSQNKSRQLEADKVALSSAHSVKTHTTNAQAKQQTKAHSNTGDEHRGFADGSSLKDNLNSFLNRYQQSVSQQAGNPQNRPSATPQAKASTASLNQSAKTLLKPRAQQPAAQGGRVKPRQPAHFAAATEKDPAIDALKQEMKSLRQLLEHQVSALMWQEIERQEPVRAMLIENLKDIGFDAQLADSIAGYIPEDFSIPQAWQQIKQILSKQLPVGHNEIIQQGGIVTLLGATGVGKTTTIAKLAAQFAQRHGADQVAMITTDTYRIGAHEQLATYGKIMGCGVSVANNSQELSKLLQLYQDKKLVLIDTAGMSQQDARLTEQALQITQETVAMVKSYIVLPANVQTAVLEQTLNQFKMLPLDGVVLTKLDESLSLAEIFNVVLRHNLPISYVTDGQQVPEDIAVADSQSLVEQALGELELSVEDSWAQPLHVEEQEKQNKVFNV